jgi:hypothetical protein
MGTDIHVLSGIWTHDPNFEGSRPTTQTARTLRPASAELVTLNKMYVNESNSTVRVGKNVTGAVLMQNGLTQRCYNTPLESCKKIRGTGTECDTASNLSWWCQFIGRNHMQHDEEQRSYFRRHWGEFSAKWTQKFVATSLYSLRFGSVKTRP